MGERLGSRQPPPASHITMCSCWPYLPVHLGSVHIPLKDNSLSESKWFLPLGNIFLFRVHGTHGLALGSLSLLVPLLRIHFLKYPYGLLPHMAKMTTETVLAPLITQGLHISLTVLLPVSHWQILRMLGLEGTSDTTHLMTWHIIRITPETLSIVLFVCF